MKQKLALAIIIVVLLEVAPLWAGRVLPLLRQLSSNLWQSFSTCHGGFESQTNGEPRGRSWLLFAEAKGVAGLGKAGGDNQGGSDKSSSQVPPEVYTALTYAGSAFLLTLSVPLILYGLNKLLNKIEDCFGCGPSSKQQAARRSHQRQLRAPGKSRQLARNNANLMLAAQSADGKQHNFNGLEQMPASFGYHHAAPMSPSGQDELALVCGSLEKAAGYLSENQHLSQAALLAKGHQMVPGGDHCGQSNSSSGSVTVASSTQHNYLKSGADNKQSMSPLMGAGGCRNAAMQQQQMPQFHGRATHAPSR